MNSTRAFNACWSAAAVIFFCGASEHAPSAKPTRHPSDNSKLQGHIQKDETAVVEDWQKLYDEGDVLYRAGKYNDAYKRWGECAIAAEKQKPWTKHSGPQLIEVLKHLAVVYKTQNKPSDACKMYDLAITTAIKAYGKDSSPVAQLMMDQGRMYTFYDSVKNYARADELLSEALRINEKAYGRYSIPAGDVDMVIAQLEENENRYDKALACWQLVIAIGDRLEPNVISCCRIGPRQGRARCLEHLGKWDDAINAHRDLIAMCRARAKDMMRTIMSNYSTCLMNAEKHKHH